MDAATFDLTPALDAEIDRAAALLLGARSVVASHWPVPDTYDATKRLISGMIEAKPGQPLADALGNAQQGLMDDANTSHPFYWAAFIILGDGAKPLVIYADNDEQDKRRASVNQ